MYSCRIFSLKNPCQKKVKKEKRGSRKTWKYSNTKPNSR